MIVIFKKTFQNKKKGSQHNVKEGFFTNFLQPQDIAVQATKENLEKLKDLQRQYEIEASELKENYKKIIEELDKKVITFEEAATATSLYASIKKQDIVKILNIDYEVIVEAHQVLLDTPIKELGTYDVDIKLDDEFKFSIKLNIISKNT